MLYSVSAINVASEADHFVTLAFPLTVVADL